MIAERKAPSSLPWLAALFATACAVAWTYSSLLTTDRCPLFRDVVIFFVPLKQFLAEALLQGRVALWNPLILFGTPFLAELQTGVFYPPSALLVMPGPLGLNAFLMLHYGIALGGAVRFLAGRGCGPFATTVGALTFVLGGYLVSLLNVMNFLQSAAWAPWILALWSRMLVEPTRGRFIALAVLFILQTLAGGVEIQLLTLMALAAQTVDVTARDPRRLISAGALLGACLGLAAAAAAFQLIPTAELVRQSSRSDSLGFEAVTYWSLRPISLLQIFLPRSSSLVTPEEQGGMGLVFENGSIWLGTIYFGIVPFLLAMTGAAWGKERRLWIGVGLIGLVLALGSSTPVFGWLYATAPWIVGKFRYPEKFFFLTHIAVAVLAADGAERIFARDRSALRSFVVAAITILAFAGAVCAVRWLYPVHFVGAMRMLGGDATMPVEAAVTMAIDVYFKSARLLVIGGVALTALWLQHRGLVRQSLLACALAGLCAADLASAHKDFNLSIEWSKFAAAPTLVDVPALRASGSRVLSYSVQTGEPGSSQLDDIRATFPSNKLMADWMVRAWQRMIVNTSMPHGVAAAFGGAGIVRGDSVLFREALKSVPVSQGLRLAAALSVGDLIGEEAIPGSHPGVTELRAGDGIYSYRIENPAPRAYLAGKLRLTKSPAETFSHLISPEFRIGEEAVVEEIPAGWSDAADEEKVGTVRIASYEPETVVLEVRADRQALLVLNDTYYPGWVARIDEQPAEIVRTNQLVRGVLVSAGEHRVVFSYEPQSFRIGLAISAAAWLILAAIGWSAWRQRTRTPR